MTLCLCATLSHMTGMTSSMPLTIPTHSTSQQSFKQSQALYSSSVLIHIFGCWKLLSIAPTLSFHIPPRWRTCNP